METPVGFRLMLISDKYRLLNERLHATHRYGERGDKWAKKVIELVEAHSPDSILDYGCGKGALKLALEAKTDTPVWEYDPAIAAKSALPEPADLVVCTDVLEHIEPDCIQDVVTHLKALTGKVMFLAVSTRPAVKSLEDGRNAHLIIQPFADWQALLCEGMSIEHLRELPDEFVLVLTRTPRTAPATET
jgi:2-polyprenyl-3-methyl-5-hydroxy-6-metoxy-1,4-benzoquinol methylase